MTKKSVQQLYQLILQDPVLRNKLKASDDPERRAQLMLQIGQEQGYQLNASDVEAFFAAKDTFAERALSDETLDTVIGGGTGGIPGLGGETSETSGGPSDDNPDVGP